MYRNYIYTIKGLHSIQYTVEEHTGTWSHNVLEKLEDIRSYNIDELVEGVIYNSEGNKYKLDNGYMYEDYNTSWVMSDIEFNKLREMDFIECEFEPGKGEKFYYPAFDKEYGVEEDWNSEQLENIKKVAGVYRTYEEAERRAKELGWII